MAWYSRDRSSLRPAVDRPLGMTAYQFDRGTLKSQGQSKTRAPVVKLFAREDLVQPDSADVLKRVEMTDVAADAGVLREEGIHATAEIVAQRIVVLADVAWIERDMWTHEPHAANGIRLYRARGDADQEIGHRRKHVVIDAWYLAEEVCCVGNVSLEPHDTAHRANGDPEVCVLILTVGQARTVGGVAAEVIAEKWSDKPIGSRGDRSEGNNNKRDCEDCQWSQLETSAAHHATV